MIDTNVLGAALSIRAVLAHFRERGTGHMLLTSSVAGRRVMPGSLYSATKHAVTAMGEALRAEVADADIKVDADRAGHGRHAVLRADRPSARSSRTTSPAR